MDPYVEKVWETLHGHNAVVIITGMGTRNGYIVLGKNHILYGVSAVQPFSIADSNKTWNIENYLNPHGGVTYCGGSPGVPVFKEEETWWIGFDCSHSGDAPSLAYIPTPTELNWNSRRGIVRSLPYCMNECELMSEHIKHLEGRIEKV